MPTLKPKPKPRVRRTSKSEKTAATAPVIEPTSSIVAAVSPPQLSEPECLDGFEIQRRLLESLVLPETDGVPLESSWHRECINLLIESVLAYFHDRSDFCVHGNLCVYYSIDQVNNRDFLGPDFFFVHGAPHIKKPNYWAIWEQGGRYPDVIIELLSPSTAKRDRTEKKEIYRKLFRTSEYFLYDPTTQTLEGFRLVGHRYEPIEVDSHGRLWSEELELWLGRWDGFYFREVNSWPRFFDPKGRLVLVESELERNRAEEMKSLAEEMKSLAEQEATRAEQMKSRAEQEATRAEQMKSLAEQEKSRAQDAESRASAAEAELARLKAQLAHKKA